MMEIFEEYLNNIIEHLKGGRKEKREIIKELEQHMDELFDSYLSAGLEADEAAKMTVNDMGSPVSLAEEFSPVLREKRKDKYLKTALLMPIIIYIIVFMGVSDYRNKSFEKYQEFAEGLESGRVELSEELRSEFFSHNYKSNQLLMSAIDCYNEEKERYGSFKMMVNDQIDIIIVSRPVYGLESE